MIEKYLGVSDGSEDAVTLASPHGTPKLEIDGRFRKQISLLKHLTRFYAIDRSALVAQQEGQKEIIRKLFYTFKSQAESGTKHNSLVPPPFDERLQRVDDESGELHMVRIIVDLIVSLTENQAVQIHDRLTGHSKETIHDRFVI